MGQDPQSPPQVHMSQVGTGGPPVYQQSQQPIQPVQGQQPVYGYQPPLQHHDTNPIPVQPGQVPYQQQQQVPGQQQFHPQQLPHQATGPVYVQQAPQLQMTTPLAALNQGPAPVDCPACRQRGITAVNYESGGTTHAWAAILCICFCAGCIPYLVTGLKDVEHRCSKCGVLLATWHRSGRTQVHLQG